MYYNKANDYRSPYPVTSRQHALGDRNALRGPPHLQLYKGKLCLALHICSLGEDTPWPGGSGKSRRQQLAVETAGWQLLSKPSTK